MKGWYKACVVVEQACSADHGEDEDEEMGVLAWSHGYSSCCSGSTLKAFIVDMVDVFLHIRSIVL